MPRRFWYNRQQICFNPTAVGVRQLVHHKFIRGIFPKQSGMQWCIVEVIRACCIGCTCFSFFARVLPYVVFLFSCVFLRTFIIVTRLSLEILFVVIYFTTLPLIRTCTFILVSNVHSIKIYIVWIQVIFSNITKFPYVLVKKS